MLTAGLFAKEMICPYLLSLVTVGMDGGNERI